MILNPSPRPIRLVAFDLDGTLIDSIGDIASSANHVLVERYGPLARLPLARVRGFVGGGARQLIERCLASMGRPEADVEPVFRRFLPVYRARLVETTLLFPGLRDALGLIEPHARLAVLTNKPGEMSRILVHALGLDGRFLGVIGGDDLKTRKPDPEGLLSLAARAGVRPDETALVGDSAIDIRTARNAGAVSIGVLWGYDREGMAKEGPDVTVQAPIEIAELVRSRAGAPRPQ